MTVPPDIDYEDLYHALDLPPGAPLRDIEDRARLLRAAFQPDLLPLQFRPVMEERMRTIERAAAELRLYWATHLAPPPIAAADASAAAPVSEDPPNANLAPPDPRSVDRLVEALAGALAAYEDEKRGATAPARREPGASPSSGSPAPPRANAHRPLRRDRFLSHRPVARPTSAAFAQHPRAAAAPAAASKPAPPGVASPPRNREAGARRRRDRSPARKSVLLKMSIVGLALALTVWLEAHRSGGTEPGIVAAPSAGLQNPADPEPAVRFQPVARPTGAAAPQPRQSLHDIRSLAISPR